MAAIGRASTRVISAIWHRPLLPTGIAFASLNYDLAPAVGVGEIARQTARALGWLRDQAGDLGLDWSRTVLAGHSAGGHLAALSAAKAGLPLRGVVSVSGVYDLEPLYHSYHQDILSLQPDELKPLSPLYGPPPADLPVILALGEAETDEFHRQQGAFAALLAEAGGLPQVVDLPGRDHFTAVDALGEVDHLLFQSVRDLVIGD